MRGSVRAIASAAAMKQSRREKGAGAMEACRAEGEPRVVKAEGKARARALGVKAWGHSPVRAVARVVDEKSVLK